MIAIALLAAAAPFNPAAADLFAREPLLAAWALTRFDTNRDGWLTSFEAQPALQAFKALADTDRDGRVTVGEYQAAKAALLAPRSAPAQATAPATAAAATATAAP